MDAAAGPGTGAGSGPGGLPVANRLARTPDHFAAAVMTGGVTAALIHNDTDAIVLVPGLRARGVRVPEDPAVIAYADEVAGPVDVPPSAVAPAKYELGARAADLLPDRPAGDEGPRRYLEPLPRLNVRA
ncbi:substrate-binding domain-containing protein [Streptomyces sp. AB3(2024)]|uniref:substrate-binding domain-containing protein n=1 Tax=Streptomyces sp. AB3(2024) TaxID=3317321 RepID=UPI0035A38A01